jgi:WD40 repeat protein
VRQPRSPNTNSVSVASLIPDLEILETVTPDDRYVVSSSDDNTLCVWDLTTGKTKTTLKGHTSVVSSVAVTPNGRHIVSGSHDNTLCVWDLKDGEKILTFTLDGKATACIVAQDNRTIIAGDGFGRLHFLQLVAFLHSSLQGNIELV